VVEHDLGVARLGGRPEGDAALEVAERLGILPGLEFAQPAQGKGRTGIRFQVEVAGEGVARGSELVRAVAQRSQKPPAVRPSRIQRDRLLIELRRPAEIALAAGRGCALDDPVEIARGLLGACRQGAGG
jgi:hypothetical protein